ncbi:WDR6 [Candida jiufengensis]|uniref:WDR6 n=1 Tax=Candida jiufengensis TaxID=497108 RepID=UPI002224D6EE|nr:WDR6 [Candida jiufengensis]KAI5956918.1 WDR6 [Candida jiufengensis]
MTINNDIYNLNEDMFQPLQHYGPVTYIQIHQNYIFVGYGPILHVYKLINDNIQLIYQKQIFKRNKIHNIFINNIAQKIIISGAKSYTVLDFTSLDTLQDSEIVERFINEWIITSCILNDGTVLLLNAYNVIYQITSSSTTKIHCGEKSILYSGSINVLNNGEIYIASGTVMNGVIIWNYNTKEIKYRLKDHEGSIFGVKIDHLGKYIISCSDDRSIKLYNFETGEILSTGWGHGSRIWNLEFLTTTNKVKIMSIGEDCTLRLWTYTNQNLLRCDKVIENCHRGKHIWSGDAQDDESLVENLKICCTGGADGRVRIHDLDKSNQVTTKLTIQDFAEHLNLSFNLKKDTIRDYFDLIHLGKLICLTSNGYIIEYDYNTQIYKNLGHYEFDYGIVNGFNDINTVLIVDKNGRILVLSYTEENIETNWIENEDVKISNIHTVNGDNKYYILLEPSNPNLPFILKEFKFQQNKLVLQNIKNIARPNSNFQLTSLTIDVQNQWIILASKKISIQIVDLNDLSIKFFQRKIAPGDTISKVSIISSQQDILNLLVLSRDGTYLITKIYKNSQNTSFEFEILLENKLTRGIIEGGFFHNKDLILYGFKSSYFFVWNETKQIEIMNEICGGNGHRHFKFYLTSFNSYKFDYMFQKDLYLCSYTGRFITQNFGILHNGTHGREIRDLSISTQQFNDGSKLLVTTSEDSTIGLNKILYTGEIINLWSMNNHISGMQKVKFLNHNYVLSSAGNEEFLIWKLSYFENMPTLKEINRLDTDKEVPDLRIMDFAGVEYDEYIFLITVYSNSTIKFWNFNKSTEVFELVNKFNYSTYCILNCEIFELGGIKYLIISATDGNIIIWNINYPTNIKLELKQKLHQSGIKAICLAQIRENFYLITGGDDNALTLNQLTTNNSSLSLIPIAKEVNAASATITSISHFDRFVVVVGVDQIVRLWSIEPTLKCLAARHTTVADVGCCDVTTINDENLLVIGGAGLSSWKIHE